MKTKIYIVLFVILYLIVAFSSFFHAVEFFELSNVQWMSVILAMAFEIGQAAVLMSILTSREEQSKFTPWLLMIILTLVQIIGNVYSSYRYILQHSLDNLKFFKEPIFIWTNLPDDQATVIVTYVSASILPIVALLMTSLITNYIGKDNKAEEQKEQEKEVKKEEKVENEPVEKNKEEDKIEEKIEQQVPQIRITKTPEEILHLENEEQEIEDEKIDENIEDLLSGEVIPQKTIETPKKSHFVNI